jgi:hypothetical protein
MNTGALTRILVPGTIIALFATHPAAQESDPLIGTWVLNVAKSTFSPGPPPQNESRTYILERQQTRMTAKGVTEPRTYLTVHQEIKATSKGTDASGTPYVREWTIVYDGKDRPITGDADADTVSLRRTGAFAVECTRKMAGRVVSIDTRVISREGTIMTISTHGINAKGQPTDDVLVFEKQ